MSEQERPTGICDDCGGDLERGELGYFRHAPVDCALDRLAACQQRVANLEQVATWADGLIEAQHVVQDELIKAQLALDAAERRAEGLAGALDISPDEVGRIMHESWAKTKRAQGFHLKAECVMAPKIQYLCDWHHPDLVPWEQLSEMQKDINRHVFDAVLAEIRLRAAAPAPDVEAK